MTTNDDGGSDHDKQPLVWNMNTNDVLLCNWNMPYALGIKMNKQRATTRCANMNVHFTLCKQAHSYRTFINSNNLHCCAVLFGVRVM